MIAKFQEPALPLGQLRATGSGASGIIRHTSAAPATVVRNQPQHFLKRIAVSLAAAIAGFSLLATPAAIAAPYTGHFAPLIAELQTRSVALSKRTSKIERNQKLAIDRILALLQRTVSTSEIRDLNNAITITRSLIKTFPNKAGVTVASALPTEPTLVMLLVELFSGFNDDISNLVSTAQTTVDGLAAGSCRDKAQIFLNQAVTALEAPGVTNFTTFSQSLSVALRATLKSQALAASNACLGGGGADSLAMTVNGTAWTAATGSTGGAYTKGTKVLVLTGAQDSTNSAVSIVVAGVTGPGTYTKRISGNYATIAPARVYFVTSGQLTITTFNLASHKLSGTFTFIAATGTNIVNTTQGTFNLKGLSVN